MTNNNGPLIELARKHVAIVAQTPMRFGCYSVPGGLTPCVAWAMPGDEGTHFAVFLALHPERLLSELLHSTPHEILAHFRFEEVCDAYLIGFIESDGTFHTERTDCAERGKSDLLLANGVLEARKAKWCTTSPAH